MAHGAPPLIGMDRAWLSHELRIHHTAFVALVVGLPPAQRTAAPAGKWTPV